MDGGGISEHEILADGLDDLLQVISSQFAHGEVLLARETTYLVEEELLLGFRLFDCFRLVVHARLADESLVVALLRLQRPHGPRVRSGLL